MVIVVFVLTLKTPTNPPTLEPRLTLPLLMELEMVTVMFLFHQTYPTNPPTYPFPVTVPMMVELEIGDCHSRVCVAINAPNKPSNKVVIPSNIAIVERV